MSLANIRTQLKTILEGVSGIGVVHDYERWANDWATFISFFKPAAQSVINGWQITRRSTREEEHAATQTYRFHTMVIHGFYSLDDSAASEKTFQDLIETICTTIRQNATLNGAAYHALPPQVAVVEQRKFGDVLCHYGEINVLVEEDVTW